LSSEYSIADVWNQKYHDIDSEIGTVYVIYALGAKETLYVGKTICKVRARLGQHVSGWSPIGEAIRKKYPESFDWRIQLWNPQDIADHIYEGRPADSRRRLGVANNIFKAEALAIRSLYPRYNCGPYGRDGGDPDEEHPAIMPPSPTFPNAEGVIPEWAKRELDKMAAQNGFSKEVFRSMVLIWAAERISANKLRYKHIADVALPAVSRHGDISIEVESRAVTEVKMP
jgi:hypothetical protein